MRALAMNLDNSLRQQPELLTRLSAVEDMTALGQPYRLFTGHRSVIRAVYRRLYEIRRKYPEPCLIFYGSGDLHHLTLPLVKTLPETLRPEVFILFDNHPDWFRESPPYHCGNWLARVIRPPWLQQTLMLGMDSPHDLWGVRFWASPWEDVTSGRIRLFPYRKREVFVPFKKASFFLTGSEKESKNRREDQASSLFGTRLRFRTFSESGSAALFSDLARQIAGKRVYISIDKDCLRPADAATDWEQGQMTLDTLCEGIRHFSQSCHIVGIDVCGEYSPEPIRDPLKQLDTMRMPWQKYPALEAIQAKNCLNEQTNLKLLDAVLRGFSV